MVVLSSSSAKPGVISARKTHASPDLRVASAGSRPLGVLYREVGDRRVGLM